MVVSKKHVGGKNRTLANDDLAAADLVHSVYSRASPEKDPAVVAGLFRRAPLVDAAINFYISSYKMEESHT